MCFVASSLENEYHCKNVVAAVEALGPISTFFIFLNKTNIFLFLDIYLLYVSVNFLIPKSNGEEYNTYYKRCVPLKKLFI